MMMASSSAYPSATNRVEKATSEFLIGPDWTLNIDICDAINSTPGFAKDVVKAVKKRLQHKSPKVQLLALTLLETMVKNCGDYVHFQIAERNVLQEMIKIVKKKADMHVRDKILTLLDSWQEAFGGPGGKHAQYYWAYDELRRIGVEFPLRSLGTAPIYTPPISRPTQGPPQPGYGMPGNSSTWLDEAMAAEVDNLSVSGMNSMWNALNLLDDMLQAVNPSDRTAVKDEVIVDLVERCCASQRKLVQMLTTAGDEELLGRGLELNDRLQSVLAKHDAIASGSPLPTQITNYKPNPSEVGDSGLKHAEVRALSPTSETETSPKAPTVSALTSDQVEEEEDDFALLARRHSKTQSTASTGSGESVVTTMVNADINISSSASAAEPSPSNALALPDPPPVKTTKEQDMIDFLSLALTTTTTTSPLTSHAPAAPMHNTRQAPIAADRQKLSFASETYSGHQGQAYVNNYIVPWAQPRPQMQTQLSSQFQLQPHPLFRFQPQTQPQFPSQPPSQSHYPQYSSGYPSPPWAASPGSYSNQNHRYTSPPTFSTPRADTSTSYLSFGARPVEDVNSFPAKGSDVSAINGDAHMGSTSTPVTSASTTGQKPFIPSYRLFEDLNVLGNGNGKYKMASNASPSLSGSSDQKSMVGGRK